MFAILHALGMFVADRKGQVLFQRQFRVLFAAASISLRPKANRFALSSVRSRAGILRILFRLSRDSVLVDLQIGPWAPQQDRARAGSPD
jgi:hypothetical protein